MKATIYLSRVPDLVLDDLRGPIADTTEDHPDYEEMEDFRRVHRLDEFRAKASEDVTYLFTGEAFYHFLPFLLYLGVYAPQSPIASGVLDRIVPDPRLTRKSPDLFLATFERLDDFRQGLIREFLGFNLESDYQDRREFAHYALRLIDISNPG